MMNPAGVQILIPVAPDGVLENFFEIFAAAAPEIGEMVNRFPRSNGRICDEHRVLIRSTNATRSRTHILSITIQKIDEETLVAVVADVTSAALREEIVRANEARLHAVFDGVRDYGIATFDLDGLITSWNHSAEVMNGFRADEVIGRSGDVLMAMPGNNRSGIMPLLERARREGWCEHDGWRIRKDGTRYWANSVVSILRQRSDDALLGFSMITRDVTERKRSEDGLRILAATDSLTGALNRRAFLEMAVGEESRFVDRGRQAAILMLDLDEFKTINDNLGHEVGDEVLRAVVAAIRAEIRSVDAIGRYGGEEFVVLLPGSDARSAEAVAERIRTKVAATTIDCLGQTARVTVSIGVAALGSQHDTIASTIRAADTAMFAAKRAGRDRVVTGDAQLTESRDDPT